MNKRIRELNNAAIFAVDGDCGDLLIPDEYIERFTELLLRNLADELIAVAQGSKKANPEWANGVDHAAMLAQRMTMNLPQWPEAE